MKIGGALHHFYRTEEFQTWKYHNFSGPAIEPVESGSTFKKSYYLYGLQYTSEQFKEAVRDREGNPFHKTAAFKQGANRT
jgi:hypothetical protein